MKIKSDRGIYYDITKSPYTVLIEGIHFKFTSQLNLTRFIDRYEREIKRTDVGMTNLYNGKYNFETNQFALIRLYNQIENRDFYLTLENGWDIRCLDDLRFVLSVKSAANV